MILNFDDFVGDTEGSVRQVLDFVGADASRFRYQQLPPGMKVRSVRLHPLSHFPTLISRAITMHGWRAPK